MATAAKALHYPKAALKVACHGSTSVSVRRHLPTSPHRAVFHAQWQGLSGWICAGAKASTCKTLHHGFVPTSQTGQGLAGPAELAAIGYLADHGVPQPIISKPCAATTKTVWSMRLQQHNRHDHVQAGEGWLHHDGFNILRNAETRPPHEGTGAPRMRSMRCGGQPRRCQRSHVLNVDRGRGEQSSVHDVHAGASRFAVTVTLQEKNLV